MRKVSEWLLRIEARRGVLRDEPNPFHIPPTHSGDILPKHTRVVRVYDHTGGWNALDFNPTFVEPDNPHTRGRFSSTSADQYAYMYVASGKRGINTALWEMLEFEGIDPLSGDFLVPPRLVKKYAIAELETIEDLYLVNMRNQDDLVPFLAKLSAIRGDDQRITRAWARYVRRVVPIQVDGLRYQSVRAGYNNALVLFEQLSSAKHGGKSGHHKLKRSARDQFLNDAATRRRVANILRIAGIGVH